MFMSDPHCLGFTKVTQCLPGYWVRKQLIKCLLRERLQHLQDDSCWGLRAAGLSHPKHPQRHCSSRMFLLTLPCHREQDLGV